MTDIGFDAGLHTAARWRAWRRWALLFVGALLFVELAGTPFVRLSCSAVGGQITAAEYIGIGGRRIVHAGEVSPTCPAVILLPLDRPVWSYAGDVWTRLRGE